MPFLSQTNLLNNNNTSIIRQHNLKKNIRNCESAVVSVQ